MLQFLTTVLLALIIFMPACYVASKYFRLSEQGVKGYTDFVDTVLEIEKAPTGAKKTAFIIMDVGTAMVYFEPYQPEVKVTVDAAFPYTDYTIILNNPQRCAPEKGCLCLFREPKFDTTLYKPGYDTIKITELSPLCQEVATPLKLQDCSRGRANNVNSYTCFNGFILERHLADKASIAVSSYYEVPRRTKLILNREAGFILFSEGQNG